MVIFHLRQKWSRRRCWPNMQLFDSDRTGNPVLHLGRQDFPPTRFTSTGLIDQAGCLISTTQIKNAPELEISKGVFYI